MAYQLQVQNINYDPTRFLTRAGEVLERAKNEHRAAEVAYAELSSKADEFEKLANDVRGRDSQAYINYKNYANTLRQHTDMLATQGVNPLLWRNLIQAKNDYARIMNPIEEGWKARDREAQRQAKYLEQHPTAIFEKDARDMGIDEWVNNPHFVSKSIDREIVANRAKERYAALQNQIMEMVSLGHIDPLKMTSKDVKQWVKANVPWLYESMEKYGVNPDEVKAFMAGDRSTLSSILNSVARETLGEFGIADWNTDYSHYSAEQNRQRRQNLDDILVSTVIGEAPNAINTSKFDKHDDKLSAEILMNRERIAADKEKWKAELDFKRNYYLNHPTNSGGKDITKAEDWYNDTLSIINNPNVNTSEANYLKEMKNLVEAASLEDRSVDYVEWLVEQVGININDLKNGAVTLKDPTVIAAIKKLDSENWKEETKHTSTGAGWAGHSLLALADVLGYLGTSVANPIDAVHRLFTDYDVSSNALGATAINKLANDLNFRKEAIHLYKNATNGSAEEKAAALQALKKMGLVDNSKTFKERLKNLINYIEDEDNDIDAQTDAYIRNSVTGLTGAMSNWEGTSKTLAASRLYAFLNTAISDKDDNHKGYFDYLRDSEDKKVKVEDFINVADVDNSGTVKNEPQVALNINKNGKVEISLIFGATARSQATKFKFDHRIIAKGSKIRDNSIKAMEEAVAEYRAASTLTAKEKEYIKKEAQTIKNSRPNDSRSITIIEAGLKNDIIYAKHLMAQSKYNKAKGEFFLNIGLNTHDINTRTTGVLEENKIQKSSDAYFADETDIDDILHK